MIEHSPGDGYDPQAHHAASERVGVPAVDGVLDEVEAAGGLPIAEQVAVFERAHEQLRRALDTDVDADAQRRPGVEPGL